MRAAICKSASDAADGELSPSGNRHPVRTVSTNKTFGNRSRTMGTHRKRTRPRIGVRCCNVIGISTLGIDQLEPWVTATVVARFDIAKGKRADLSRRIRIRNASIGAEFIADPTNAERESNVRAIVRAGECIGSEGSRSILERSFNAACSQGSFGISRTPRCVRTMPEAVPVNSAGEQLA